MTPTTTRSRRQFAAFPLFLIAVSFAGGVLAVEKFAIAPLYSLIAASGLAILALTAFTDRIRSFLILAAFLFAGAFSFEVSRAAVPPNDLGRIYDAGTIPDRTPVTVTGTIAYSPERSPDGTFLRMRVETIETVGEPIPVSGVVRILAPAPDDVANEKIGQGDRVSVSCELTRESEFRNPGGAERREILDSQDLDATCALRRESAPEILSRSSGARINLASELRTMIMSRFLELFEPQTAGILSASLLGNKHFLDREAARLFREGGTFHILVISGLHITIIGGMALFVIRRLTRHRGVQFVASAAFIWMFAFAVGAEIPVVRAAMMFTSILAARVLYRRLDPLNGLGFCALILLVARPEEVFDRSFQMTFISMCALVAFAFPLLAKLRAIGEWRPDPASPFPPETDRVLRIACETLYWRDEKWDFESDGRIWSARLCKNPIRLVSSRPRLQNLLRWTFEGAIVSFVMQIWMLPVSALYFNRVSYSAVISNLWVTVFIGAETALALVALPVAAVSEAAAIPLVAIVEGVNGLLLCVPETLYNLDLAGTRVPAYAGYGVSFYWLFYVPLVILSIALGRWDPVPAKPAPSGSKSTPTIVKLAIGALLLLAVIITSTPFATQTPDGRLRVDFIDVGQGDAALVTFPTGELMLVDGGGRPDFGQRRNGAVADGARRFESDRPSIGETVVSRFLWSRGISRIDYVVATHADADHIEGLADIASNFRIGIFMAGRSAAGNPNFQRLSRELGRRSVPSYEVGRGDVMSIGRATVEFLHPVPEYTADERAGNNESVVIRLTLGKRSFLLTGDIERQAERDISSAANVRADVVKVAHHGSRTSSVAEFIAATGAGYAVIAVGRRSPYGHPHNDVVTRWREAGAEILTTGDAGTVTVSTDGSELSVSRFVRPP